MKESNSTTSYQYDDIFVLNDFPYKRSLSLTPILGFWKEREQSGNYAERLIAEQVLSYLDDISPKSAPKCSDLACHIDFIELLMSSFYPLPYRGHQLGRAFVPFSKNSLFLTPALQNLLNTHEVEILVESQARSKSHLSIIDAGNLILTRLYGAPKNELFTYTIVARNIETKITSYYKAELNNQFVEVKAIKELKPLTPEFIETLRKDISNIELWLEALPPNAFEFKGVALGNIIDISNQVRNTKLKEYLLDKSSITTKSSLAQLEGLLKDYLKMPDLKIGLTEFDRLDKRSSQHNIKYHLLADEYSNITDIPNFDTSVYGQALEKSQKEECENLELKAKTDKIAHLLVSKGIRNVVVVPLISNEKTIGFLELASLQSDISDISIEIKIEEVIKLITNALKRSRDETDNQIESVMREKFTAIHPSVEWKFREIAFDLLQRRQTEGANTSINPIKFKNVFPLYGQADIVGSSLVRNATICQDLRDNLSFVQNILTKAIAFSPYPLLEKYLYDIEEKLKELTPELVSKEENDLIHFIREDVNPTVEQLEGENTELDALIKEYFQLIDPNFGFIYKTRKAYEDSVMLINDTISQILTRKEVESQHILPHYFSKYRTDGVEFDMYIGQSFLQSGKFLRKHLQNLRLWQLMLMCDIAKGVKEATPKMDIAMDTAQLVFVYNHTISLAFRMDEKKFDVDGAYNIRYEILKKRIDKAHIFGTNERLTVAGKVAIVYSSENTMIEYKDYLKFMIQKEIILPEIEHLELEQLQGVQGLKALRVSIKY